MGKSIGDMTCKVHLDGTTLIPAFTRRLATTLRQNARLLGLNRTAAALIVFHRYLLGCDYGCALSR